jgi:uncharacterized protein YjbJ (UPF0337 family)
MSTETLTGKLNQLKGKVKQSFGEATNDESLANSGVADQVKGHVKEAWGNTKDAAHSVSEDAKARAEAEHAEAKAKGEDTDHNVRESIVNAAQNFKDAVVRHTDEIKSKH